MPAFPGQAPGKPPQMLAKAILPGAGTPVNSKGKAGQVQVRPAQLGPSQPDAAAECSRVEWFPGQMDQGSGQELGLRQEA